jgi:phenylpyruvate tautomerase PptA (4-oxalocrotonate tautomerase family)
MPLTQITMRAGKSEKHKQAIMDGIYAAMRETFAVPEGDRFMTVSEFTASDFSFGPRYPDVERSDDLVIIQITVSNNRTQEQKLALYKAIDKELEARVGCRPDDVFINIVETLPENWSFGQGRAQNVK